VQNEYLNLKMPIKKDKYLNARGGTVKFVDVSCTNCGEMFSVYQKDGPGWLKRCYLNRIIESSFYGIKKVEDIKNLTCSCGNTIGTPMKHKDGRLAFKLIRGNFVRTLNKSQK